MVMRVGFTTGRLGCLLGRSDGDRHPRGVGWGHDHAVLLVHPDNAYGRPLVAAISGMRTRRTNGVVLAPLCGSRATGGGL